MIDINTIIEKILPILAIAVVASPLVAVSIQGIKNFFKVELKGNYARIVTVLVATFWSWSLTMYFGDGTWQDFAMVLAMVFMGATGIYEVLMSKPSK